MAFTIFGSARDGNLISLYVDTEKVSDWLPAVGGGTFGRVKLSNDPVALGNDRIATRSFFGALEDPAFFKVALYDNQLLSTVADSACFP